MATEIKQTTKEPAVAAAPAPAPAPGALPDDGKRRKRKYSRGLREVQRWERGTARASRRIGRAIAAGLDTYFERRERSSYKRRDGAIRDALKNWSKGMSKTLRKASDAPYDIVKALDTRSVRRTVKLVVRSLSLPLLR
jgi:hypothetical protein